MATAVATAVAVTVPAPMTVAQEDGGSFIEEKLEELLSGAGRVVTVRGFAGALSSTASLEEMTIADDEGVWLTLRDAELSWSRLALLRGRLDVEYLRAGEIIVDRPPLSDPEAPSPEATGFSLPELPVSIEIGEVSADRLALGAPLLGRGAELSLAGAVSLADGAGTVRIEADRIDGLDGRFEIDGAFDNASRVLTVGVLLDEAAGGITAGLAGLPGEPAMRLAVDGSGPLDDFEATLVLATSGEERLAGTLALSGGAAEGRTFQGDLGGDVAPLFLPAYREFFGPDVAFTVAGRLAPSGALTISSIDLEAAQLSLSGSIATNEDGLPQRIDLTGRIVSADGEPVLLPASGEPTEIGSADLAVQFDADVSERWNAQIEVEAFRQGAITAEALTLDGSGRIVAGAVPEVTADISAAARALDLGDPAVEAALGETVTAEATVFWRGDQPLRLDPLVIRGESYALDGQAVLVTTDLGPDLEAGAEITAGDLSVFSGLAGRTLAGRIEATVGLRSIPSRGLLKASLAGRGTGLSVGIPDADALLAGAADLDAAFHRDQTGTYLERFTAKTDVADLSAEGQLITGGGAANARVLLRDPGVLVPGFAGPLTAEFEASGTDNVWAIDASVDGAAMTAAADLEADLTGAFARVSGEVALAAQDLAPLGPRIGREIGGGADLRASGVLVADFGAFDVTLNGTTQDLVSGVPDLDKFLVGETVLRAVAARGDGGPITISALDARSEAAAVTAEGTVGLDRTADIRAAFDLFSPGLVAPGLPGPLALRADVKGGPDDWAILADVEGPGTAIATDLALAIGGDVPRAEGSLTADLSDISPFSEIAGRSLGGSVRVQADGSLVADLSAVDVALSGGSDNLRVGIDAVNKLFAGTAAFSADVDRGDGVLSVRALDLETPQIRASAEADVGAGEDRASFDVRLANLGLFVPDLSGPVTASGTAERRGGSDWTIATRVDGPGGIGADISGGVAADFARVDLTARGQAPLSAANPFIEPRAIAGTATFDLAVQGPPALGSVSGRISASGAQVVAPELGVVLEGVEAGIGLRGTQAAIDVGANVQGGGRLTVDGSLGLDGTLPAALTVRLANAVATDGSLYETIVNGSIGINGPLAGGARIAGDLALGPTEIGIPSGAAGGSADIDGLVHRNEPRQVRRTRVFAGLVETGPAASGGGGGPVYPLEITVTAPNQIFIRGRGLEAEMGGRIVLGGTTQAPIPTGQFELIRGRLDLLGQRFSLDEGQVSLQGNFDPTVRLVATTETSDTRISIIVQGSALSPDITFESDPPLPEDEVIARLLFGRSVETLSPLQAARLAGAVATLTGRGGSGFLGGVREGAGLADLDVTSGADGGVGVRAGAYISENIYTDVTVDSAGRAAVSVNLDVSRSVTVKGTVGNEGQAGVGVFFERDY